MSPVETLLLDVDERHAGHCGGNSVQWDAECLSVGCAWTAYGDVGGLRAALDAHRAHVAAEQAKALREWLTSDETVEVAAAAAYESPGPEGKARWAWLDARVWDETREVWRFDTRAGLAALADLIGGAR